MILLTGKTSQIAMIFANQKAMLYIVLSGVAGALMVVGAILIALG